MDPVVDLHAHVLPSYLSHLADTVGSRYGMDFARREPDGRLMLRQADHWSPLLQGRVYEETVDDRVARMDAMRVDIQILSLSPSMHIHALDVADGVALARDTNDAIAETIAARPERFRGLGFLPLQSPPAAIAELERIMASRLFVGAMVATNVAGADWDHPALQPVLAAAEALGAFVFVHPVGVRAVDLLSRHHLRNLVGNPLETTVAIASLIFGGVLDRHPDLVIGFAHAGGYACWGVGRFDHGHRVRPEAAATSPPSSYLRRLYFDSLTHDELALRHLIDQVGVGQVILGTDDPADMAQNDPVSWLEGCGSISADERHAILGGNLTRLIGSRLVE